MSWQGARALVTGAASGIGLAVCQQLRDGGAEVLGLDRAAGTEPGVTWLAADVADRATVTHAVQEALGDGALDVLVNSAGIGRPS